MAQSFTPSSSWQEPNMTTSVAERIDIADQALTQALLQFDEDTGLFSVMPDVPALPAYLYYEMARFDTLTNNTKYKNRLSSYFSIVRNAHPDFSGFTLINEPLTYGYAAIHAYKVYQDQSFLQYAQDAWQFGLNYTVTSDATSAGRTGVKNFDLQSQCNGSSIVGGTFFQTDPNDPYIAGIGTGAFLVLSALLAEATSNQTYLSAASQSSDFILNHLTDASNILLDGLYANSCSNNGNPILSYNSGLGIEGLAILSSQTNNSTMNQRLNEILSTVILSAPWLDSRGIVETSDDRPQYLMFALSTAYNRTQDNDIKEFLGHFLSVQHNAILHQATVNGSNVYGKDWVGPPLVQVSPRSQTAALSVLVNAIALPDVVNGTSNLPASPNPDSSSSSKSSNLGPIIGGVVGGVVFVLIICLALWRLFKYNREKRAGDNRISYATPYIEPGNHGTGSGSASALMTEQRHSSNFSVTPTASGTNRKNRPGDSRNLVVSNQSESTAPAQLGSGNGDGMSTEELVRLLSQRLHNEQRVPSEEAPPAYRKT
ncbi:hypothetical protein K435DRAFT_785372 [Dendrothele bispora CBS 962.96]|uniref:Glycoside hydrolase family 76 protein n=1 Tax=Dendrothele bispora (strain CBS 962.96) TaxID=1314807 RepID=A0A4S8KX44_DENBC|nr:hypothetical protein K435DRAFT_785372 [Dendrothele bispora CBS 962.96]